MKIKKQLISLAILLGLFVIFQTTTANWSDGMDEIDSFTTSLPSADAADVIEGFMLWLLIIFTFLAVIAFVVSGIMFLTAGSNSKMLEKAKASVGYSVLGIVIGLAGYIIIRLINDILDNSI